MNRIAALAATLLVCFGVGVQAQSPPRPPHPAADADAIDYDNTTSGLDADNVQEAIDELEAEGGGGAGVGDGDKTDITVSSSGTVWNIDAGAVGGTEVDESSLGAVPTATALASNPTDCSANNFATTIAASGNLTCALPTYTETVPFIFSPTAYTSKTYIMPDIDDAPGASDGAGADPDPWPGNYVTEIQFSGVTQNSDTNSLNVISNIATFNKPGSAGYINDLHNSGLVIENTYNPSAQPSGQFWTEFYWQFGPSTHIVTFSAGGSGAITIGDLVTFTGGEICRPLMTDSDLSNGAVIRMNCLAHDPPDNTNVITLCTGCTGTPSGTVSGTPTDEAVNPWRPIFFETFTHQNRTNFKIQRGYQDAATQSLMYWINANEGDDTLFLGHQTHYNASTQTEANMARVNIPHGADAYTSLVFREGDIAIDTTVSGAVGGGRLGFGDRVNPAAFRWWLSPIQHTCWPFTDLDVSDVNLNFPMGLSIPITILGLGLRNDTSTSPATPATITVEDLAGDAITLGGTVTAAGSGTAITYQSITMNNGSIANDTDANIPVGGGVRIDVTNTPNPATDEHTICVAWTPSNV